MSRTVLKLFVAGRTSRSEQAIRNLRTICRDSVEEEIEVVIIDVLEHPRVAEAERICAAPVVVREEPPPARRVVGDLADSADVMAGLGLRSSVS